MKTVINKNNYNRDIGVVFLNANESVQVFLIVCFIYASVGDPII